MPSDTGPDMPWLSRRLILGRSLGTAIMLTGASRGTAHAASRAESERPLVVIDPGHGGKDPGAIGVAGGFEKDVTFATARELARQINARGRCRVVLTREHDVFIPLAERIGMAEQRAAALFISLHADALHDHRVRGASVYTLSANASDAQAAALAARENDADRYAAATDIAAPPAIAAILGSLARREARLGSVHLQRQVVSAIAGVRDMLEQPARHAGFAVLRSASVPSVLVEMGFMSNQADEAALKNPRYQARLASALCRAVEGSATSPALGGARA